MHCLGYEHLPGDLFDLRDKLNELIPEQLEHDADKIKLLVRQVTNKKTPARINLNPDLLKLLIG